MDGPPPAVAPRRTPWCLFAVLAVTAGQAGLALDLFGPGGLTDARPVAAGRHPLHLYHATLGAETFRARYTTSCYDPAFQAGYPKTPVFDGGCRPAELFLLAAGPTRSPAAAYKLGLFAVCLLAPVCFAAAARAAGAGPTAGGLAAALGCLAWWTPPVRALLDDGHIDLLLAGLMGLVFVGGLARYADHPGLAGWAVLSASAVLGWYAHPVVWLGLLPVLTVYYVAVAPRHGPIWHLGMVGVTAAGLAPNLWWLWDWGRFWWLRQPSVDEFAVLPGWDKFAGSAADYVPLLGAGPVGWATVALGVAGVVAMARAGLPVAAGLAAVTAGYVLVVARLGETWTPLMAVTAARAAPVAVGVLVTPAAFLLARWWGAAAAGPAAVAAVVLTPVVLGWGGPVADAGRATLGLDIRPLPLGLTPDQRDLVAGLTTYTTPDARTLVEDPVGHPPGWNWTALVPGLTGRPLLGGLDPDACIEHMFCGLRGGKLNGRPFADWTAAERATFAWRYNVGWVLCRTPDAADFWRADPTAREVGRFRDGGEVVLFELDRPRSYVLVGSATVTRLDRHRVILSDVVPNESGEVVLSLHHQPGLRAGPTGVGVDVDKDPFDPIPLLKLRVPGPVSRVAVSWDNP